MTDSHPTASRLHLPPTVTAAEPWIRDHYDVLRAEMGPRWDRTRAAVAPAMDSAVARFRDDVAPGASQAANRLACEAARRTAPLRNEATSRGVATIAAMRGQVSASDVSRIQHRSRTRTLWIVGAAAVAAGLGVAAWQRARARAWVEDDAVLSALAADEESAPRGQAAGTAAGGTRTRGTTAGQGMDPAGHSTGRGAHNAHKGH